MDAIVDAVRLTFPKGAWWIFTTGSARRHAKKMGHEQTAERVAQRIPKLAAGLFNLPAAASTAETQETCATAWRGAKPQGSTIQFYGSI